MYFSELPNHNMSAIERQLHYNKFQKHNIIYEAKTTFSFCEDHVGCLSIKTMQRGEEWYRIDGREIVVRPGQFLILNNDQAYACNISSDIPVKTLSIFFKKHFAAAILRELTCNEDYLLDNPFDYNGKLPEFFQTLNSIDSSFQQQLTSLLSVLHTTNNEENLSDERLIFILQHLIAVHKNEVKKLNNIDAIKQSTKTEVFKRLCTAKDFMHATFMESPNLESISKIACLSVPQLVRQFKTVFHCTPHQYLIQLRMSYAKELLKSSGKSINEIGWQCGFDNFSAFCRAFKSQFGVQPSCFRN